MKQQLLVAETVVNNRNIAKPPCIYLLPTKVNLHNVVLGQECLFSNAQ